MGDEVRDLLNHWFLKTNRSSFIPTDPISIPHRFQKQQDIEIAGFMAAIMSWGSRQTIIAKASELMERMGQEPHGFVMSAGSSELQGIEGFVHRTLNVTDVLFLIEFLRHHYTNHQSLETAFFPVVDPDKNAVELGLGRFHRQLFSLDFAPKRTQKHIATPEKGSACKRLNMFLRWMVRSDEAGVDFGLWKHINASQLICPLDVHVHRVALHFGIIGRQKADWQAAEELTQALRKIDRDDPVKYDYALFGMGVDKLSRFGKRSA